MAWKLMIPSPGGRRADCAVTLACRDNSHGKGTYFNWIITMTSALRLELAWDEKAFARVTVDEDAGLAMLSPCPAAPDAWRYTVNKTALQGILPLEARGTRRIGATRIPFEVQGRSLMLKLPKFAGGKVDIAPSEPRAPRGRAAVTAIPVPSPVVARPGIATKSTPTAPSSTLEGLDRGDIREAIQMVIGGDTNLRIMERFKWSKDRVEHMRRLAAAIPRRDGPARMAGVVA